MGYSPSDYHSSVANKIYPHSCHCSRLRPFPGRSPATTGSRCRAFTRRTRRSTPSGCSIAARGRRSSSPAARTSSPATSRRSLAPCSAWMAYATTCLKFRSRGSARSAGFRRSPARSATCLVRGTIFAPYGRDADVSGAVYALSIENQGRRGADDRRLARGNGWSPAAARADAAAVRGRGSRDARPVGRCAARGFVAARSRDTGDSRGQRRAGRDRRREIRDSPRDHDRARVRASRSRSSSPSARSATAPSPPPSSSAGADGASCSRRRATRSSRSSRRRATRRSTG